jgi:hypothetical protein
VVVYDENSDRRSVAHALVPRGFSHLVHPSRCVVTS